MKEAWSTVKAFLSGWGSLTLGIVGIVVLLYILYIIVKAILF